ncbi:hypothetical protein WR25_09644 [Diploscapter pachys]|uniref:G-protein coupled receptors family 1 profile domain-containing protein n=1 Tax=Diploscapter pachys TaxID=2018661 RepID=A0A2A2J4X6_9BILA|nr:hypothetical protein WR25_09644 [Diploscapter pachys]
MEPYDTPTSLDPAHSGFNDTFSDESDLYNNSLPLPFFRHDTSIVIILSISYLTVFIFGILGNTFVVLAVLFHKQLRSTTDYLISSLAIADLLILLFCLPTTLVVNILTEWPLGSIFCKLSTWINTTTSFSSVYTLVAVTADRYFAICHTLKYALWDSSYTFYVIMAIWLISGASWLNVFYRFDTITIVYEGGEMIVCNAIDQQSYTTQFLIILCLGLVVPLILISVCYTLIFITVSTHRSLAVDAHIRDERVKLRVATMMLTVIVVFTLCWVPLYVLYVFITFFLEINSEATNIAHLIRASSGHFDSIETFDYFESQQQGSQDLLSGPEFRNRHLIRDFEISDRSVVEIEQLTDEDVRQKSDFQ